MKKLILILIACLPALAWAQTEYTGTYYTPVEFECKDEYLTWSGGQRNFTGMIIRKGNYIYYLDYPISVRVSGNNLIFTDLDSYVDRVTVALDSTSYATLADFKAAAIACDSLVGGSGGGGAGVDTSGYNSAFTITSDSLKITDDNSTLAVDLSPYLDNTDAQTLSISNDTLSISGGNSVVVPTTAGGLIDSLGYYSDTLRIYEDGNGTYPQMVEIVAGTGPGGASIIEVTYAEMDSLISNSLLTEGQFYNITDAAGTDLGFITQAIKDNEITMTGTSGYLNADFQAVGDYSGVEAITGVAAGTQQGIWTVGIDSTLTTGDIVIWDLKHWQCLEDTLTDGTDPATNVTAYQELLKTDTNQGYIEEWDGSEFDFTNNWLQYRADKRGNKIYSSASGDNFWEYGESLIRFFQWGNDEWYGNICIESGIFDTNTKIKIYNNYLTSFCFIGYNTAVLSGASLYPSIYSNILDNESYILSLSMLDDSYVSYNTLSTNSFIESVTASNVNAFSIYRNDIRTGGILNYTFSGTGTTISTNTIKYAYIKNINPGESVTYNSLVISEQIDSYTGLIAGRKLDLGFSNFSDTLDVTNLDTLDLTGYDYVGIFYLTSTNATDTLTQITNFPTAFPFTLRPVPGLAVTFTATSISSAVAGDIILPAASFTADGDKQDWIEFEQDSGGVGFVKYKNGVNNY